jgi:hypothetical protein
MACLSRPVRVRRRPAGGTVVKADRWKELHPIFLGRFGPEASTIGPPEEWERAPGSVGEEPHS